MERYEALKKIILEREKSRLVDCRDSEGNKTLQAQGAARELAELVSEMEQLEHPPVEAGED